MSNTQKFLDQYPNEAAAEAAGLLSAEKLAALAGVSKRTVEEYISVDSYFVAECPARMGHPPGTKMNFEAYSADKVDFVREFARNNALR